MTTYPLTLVAMMLLVLGAVADSRAQAPVPRNAQGTAMAQKPLTEPVSLETPTGTLYGTLERPASPSPVPVVLIIAGSGPTDRDGNAPAFKSASNCLKLLAEGLLAHGIASLRYDKRGIGESGKAIGSAGTNGPFREEDLRFETYIDDAVLWGKKLRADTRFSSLSIIGHSEGSLIGMVAARRVGATAFLSLAGSGRPAQQILLEQLRSRLTPDLFATSESILGQLATGKKVEAVPPALNVLFRPSVQPYMISWMRYDPAIEIARLSIPTLILQGTTDIQVSVQDARLLARAKPSAKLLLIEGMNHILKEVPPEHDKQIASYSDPSLPVAPRLIEESSAFVGSVAQPPAR